MMELNRDFKRLLEELGAAINESLAESDRIGEVMGRIKAAGYDLFLVLEVTIGFDKRSEGNGLHHRKLGKRSRLQITGEDLEFLKALQISLDDEKRD
jgi:hypothetical protein